jgi:hypothetical protein
MADFKSLKMSPDLELGKERHRSKPVHPHACTTHAEGTKAETIGKMVE